MDGDGYHHDLAHGMEQGPEVTLSKTMGQGQPEGENDGDFRPYQRTSVGGKKKDEGCEENHALDQLKKEERREISVETWVEVLGETLPEFRHAGIHPTTDQGDGMPGVGAVQI